MSLDIKHECEHCQTQPVYCVCDRHLEELRAEIRQEVVNELQEQTKDTSHDE